MATALPTSLAHRAYVVIMPSTRFTRLGEVVVNKLLQRSEIVHAVETPLIPDFLPTSFREADSDNRAECQADYTSIPPRIPRHASRFRIHTKASCTPPQKPTGSLTSPDLGMSLKSLVSTLRKNVALMHPVQSLGPATQATAVAVSAGAPSTWVPVPTTIQFQRSVSKP
jgi:hypothetical protein